MLPSSLNIPQVLEYSVYDICLYYIYVCKLNGICTKRGMYLYYRFAKSLVGYGIHTLVFIRSPSRSIALDITTISYINLIHYTISVNARKYVLFDRT